MYWKTIFWTQVNIFILITTKHIKKIQSILLALPFYVTMILMVTFKNKQLLNNYFWKESIIVIFTFN